MTNGLTALTTPAPVVQRLPTPAASVTTATSPPPHGRLAALDRRGGHGPRRRDQVGVVDVADVGVDRQAVAGQADPAALEVVAELLVLDGVEAVLAADRSAACVPLGDARRRRPTG